VALGVVVVVPEVSFSMIVTEEAARCTGWRLTTRACRTACRCLGRTVSSEVVVVEATTGGGVVVTVCSLLDFVDGDAQPASTAVPASNATPSAIRKPDLSLIIV